MKSDSGGCAMQRGGYNTRQKAQVMEELIACGAHAVTAEALIARLRAAGKKVGKTTVYRQLERLCAQGYARSLPGPEGTLYQYVENADACLRHLHCRCVDCGQLMHVDCGCLDTLTAHLAKEHHFALDAGLTVLLGVCRECQGRKRDGADDA